MPKEDFERDFGYLLPFFDRVRQAGAQLPADSRAELEQLIKGEKEKWARIRALLSVNSDPAKKAEKDEGALPPVLTVGSLKGR